MKKNNQVFKAGIGYTIGNILIKGINFLVLPIFSRILTTEEFGVYNVFLSIDAILFVVIGMALHSSIRSANYEYKGKIDSYVSSISIIYIINLLIYLLFVSFFAKSLSQFLAFDIPILYLLGIYSFSSSIISLYNNRISLEYSYGKYLVLSLVNSLGNILLSLFLIMTICSEHKDVGRILGTTLTMLLIAIYALWSLYKKSKPRIRKIYWKYGIKYSLPIVPHGISQVLLAQCDRIMIRNICSSSDAGIYSLAGNIQLILIIITDSISTAWSTWFYSEMNKNNKELIQEKAIQVCILFSIFSVGLMSISPELVCFLGGEDYDLGKYVAIPMIIASFLLFLYNIIVPREYYTGKTIYIMLGTIIAAIINIIANYIFISKFGFIAAAYTTLFSYVCYLILHLFISYRLVHFNVIPIGKLILFGVVVVCVSVADLLLINRMLCRWSLCALIVLPMASWLFKKNCGMLKKKRIR